MDMRRNLCYTSTFIIILLFICSCAGTKTKDTFKPQPTDEFTESEIKDTSKDVEKPEEEKETLKDELERTEYKGIEGEVLELPKLKDVHFAFDKSNLTPESQKRLVENVILLKMLPDCKIQIEGHCDERGSTEYNLALGERRAFSVKRYLVSLNFPVENISTISYGEERPVDRRHNEAAWAKNRRAHIVILSYKEE